MNLDILENKMLKAIKYASNIITETSGFIEFAIALTDYMGKDFIPYCKSVYMMLASSPEFSNITFNYEDLKKITSQTIESEYGAFVSQQQKKQRELEFKENIDELQFLVRSYRNSQEFKKLLDIVGRLNYLAPYNAMLVQMQKPGATFVFSGKKWLEYGRRPQINAQKLIILKPFGPVQCVFDYEDTEEIPGALNVLDEVELMGLWDEKLKQTKGEVKQETWNILMKNLPVYGIYLDDNFQAANTYGGYIIPNEEKQLSIMVNKKSVIINSRFIICVNKNHSRVMQFHTICHELGHLFCYHLFYTQSKIRKLTIKEREFEAETVAWLVCKRHGIYNPSEKYLASYAPHEEIPICSTDLIMKAVAEIEKMMESPIIIKEALWYKENKGLKEKIRDIEQQRQDGVTLLRFND